MKNEQKNGRKRQKMKGSESREKKRRKTERKNLLQSEKCKSIEDSEEK